MKPVSPSSTTSLSRPGTLVHARGREWVVLPDSTDELLMLRPVGGLDEEMTGILPAIEPVQSAKFPLPSREDLGDFHSGRLLRDAARLSTRAAAGPIPQFRPHRRRPSTLSACAVDDGAQIESRPHAHCRRRGDRQDD